MNKDVREITQLSIRKYLPSDSSGNVTEREREIALAVADEVLNIALMFYANSKISGRELGRDFFDRIAEDKQGNEVSIRLLKCFSENISRINFMLLPPEAQSEIIKDLRNCNLRGVGKIPKDYAEEVLEVLNSEGDRLGDELESMFDNISTSRD